MGDMNETDICREVIRQNIISLAKQIPVTLVVLHLYQDELIDLRTMDSLLTGEGEDRAFNLLRYIPSILGTRGLKYFRHVLRAVGVPDLAERLQRTEKQNQSNHAKSVFNLSDFTKVSIMHKELVLMEGPISKLLLSKKDWAVLYTFLPSTLNNTLQKTYIVPSITTEFITGIQHG